MIYKAPFWNKTDVEKIVRFHSHIPEIKQEDIERRLITR
jgi:hypothetical protein